MTRQQAARVRSLIRALRSGKFRQCKNRLRSFTKDCRFCASGVACELYARAMNGTDGFWKEIEALKVMEFQAGAQSNSETLPHLVRQWYGFGVDGFPQQFIPAEVVKEWKLNPLRDVARVGLEQLNDGTAADIGFSTRHAGMTFTQIANVLERWLRRQPVSV